MYAVSIYKYLYDFRKPLQNAALKLKPQLELRGVSNSANRDAIMHIHIVFNPITTEHEACWAVPGPLMGPWKGHRSRDKE